ncbi:MAG: dehydrogenase [Rhodopirellula sp.]|nr:dehydrogenase [Rhodopirellula sp.]
MCRFHHLFLILAVLHPLSAKSQIASNINAINTQAAGEHPPTPTASATKMAVPEGFAVTLFAGEPSVHQPIAMEIDDRGRLWVVECYTYEGNYDLKLYDRILIFEDSDGDGKFDRRQVFWDEGQRLTGITLGFGGVWVTSAPNLLFIPDRDQNDVPDSEPVVVLAGFSTRARHNMVNGLRWGPDGWLYGRHGITDSSMVGTPNTPLGKRTRLNCSIWRYHPTQKVFEVVTHGTTNPWGLDYNDHGQWFFTNNVINHLWHVIPGAHYQRMFGDDFNPNLYALIPPTADHFHWDTLGNPEVTDNSNRKKYDGRHDSHGGGHSHAGAMIYLGGKWPQEYRGTIFMCNTHGRRVNRDRLNREGNGYRGSHEADFLLANDPWFRGVEMKYGPDGDVYLTDWSDLGECHDRDGVHRTSGRIYKIIYNGNHESASGTSQTPQINLASPTELVELQLHSNDWYVRHARRRLQELATEGVNMDLATSRLLSMFESHPKTTRKLRALWCLASINAVSNVWVIRQLGHPDEHVRLWAVQLLAQSTEDPSTIAEELASIAVDEPSPLVRLYLASAMQKLPPYLRWGLATALVQHSQDADDPAQPLMIWYGIEPAVSLNPSRALALAKSTLFPIIRRHVSRLLASKIDKSPEHITKLLQAASQTNTTAVQDYLHGIAAALRGRRKIAALPAWLPLIKQHQTPQSNPRSDLASEILVVFGDGRTIESLLETARNREADPTARRQALRVILDSGADGIEKTLLSLRSDRIIGAEAIRGLAQYPAANVPRQLINMYPNAKHDHRPAIIYTLASRPSYATHLLDALAEGTVTPSDIPAGTASRIANLGDPKLNERLAQHWGSVRATSAEKERSIQHYRSLLTSVPPKSDTSAFRPNVISGHKVFQKSCANCHRMFGEGSEIGPDLTGSNRDSVEYLLDNIIDPSRIVPRGMRQVLLLLDDGRIITGVPIREDDHTLTIQTADRLKTFEIIAVQRREQQETSLMPEGLLENLSSQEVVDLFAFLQSSLPIRKPLTTAK